MEKNVIKSFRDLEVYQNSYQASLEVATKILSQLPNHERFDLKDQLSRSSKAIPRLIAEGYAKKHQRFGFQKYLDDAMAECNETIVSLEHARDIYHLDRILCDKLVDEYDKSGRQLYKLGMAWDTFTKRRSTSTNDDTGSVNEKR